MCVDGVQNVWKAEEIDTGSPSLSSQSSQTSQSSRILKTRNAVQVSQMAGVVPSVPDGGIESLAERESYNGAVLHMACQECPPRNYPQMSQMDTDKIWKTLCSTGLQSVGVDYEN